ncbi:efflux transporter outer membrane subunit [Cupriavidus pauculus]|uniref:efflux transporter outer membrane subunit n=1 Tax=Cupriavidus pauculus TaxID=82633 RepID=UPI001EE1C806|nr:efflux transporter outer membrane subunit [Cupriavidus pauculus]GJG94226.1 efflux transporter outer membrane subunit [Cupriavidus pauculus]
MAPPVRAWLALAALLGGCARVGPDFQPQNEAWSAGWHSDAVDQASTRRAAPDLRQWWQVFGDPVLEALMAQADAGNADVRVAGLRVMEARAQLGIALAGRYPQMQQASASAMYVNSRQSGPTAQTARLWEYSAGVDVGWELDFWGRFARAIESADGAYFAAQANREAVLVLLHAQLATTYFAVRTAEARLRIARENARLQHRSFEITERLFKGGESDELDFQQARTQYLGTLSSVPELENQIGQARNALVILLGRPPGPLPELDGAPERAGQLPLIDRAVLQDVPASLLLRRPDIRAAEWRIAAQSAQIGVARADLYPSVSLMGSIGWSATSLPGTQNGLLLVGGPSVRWNIFDYGRIVNNVRVQDARLQQLIVDYQAAVRQAAREADDAASGLAKALQRERILGEAAQSAERSLSLANTLFREGYSDFQRVLDAQRALFAQQDGYLVNRGNAVNYLIALYKALGGGWDTSAPLLDAATRTQMQQRTDWGDLLDEVSNQVRQVPTQDSARP